MHTYTHAYIRTRMHAYVRTRTHTYTHAQMAYASNVICKQRHISLPFTRASQKSIMSATCDHQAEQEGQLSLTKGQLVHIVDSKRSDWWLCSTTSGQSATGWVRAQCLIPCISKRILYVGGVLFAVVALFCCFFLFFFQW